MSQKNTSKTSTDTKQEGQRPQAKDLSNDELDASTTEVAEKIDELIEDKDMDNLLDEIDSVLEENAEEFVKNYVQRGGE